MKRVKFKSYNCCVITILLFDQKMVQQSKYLLRMKLLHKNRPKISQTK